MNNTDKEQDKKDIKLGLMNKVDYIACSFVNSANDILKVRKFIEDNGGDVKLIAKIEM